MTAVLLALGAGATVSAHADQNLPLPLSGAAYAVARQAYAAYDAHDYRTSVALAREAIRQRPDVASLRLLLANALAAEGRLADASRALADAVRDIGADPTFVARREEIDRQLAARRSPPPLARTAPAATRTTAGAAGTLPDPARAAAQRAYDAYAAKDFAGAAQQARSAVALAPDVLRLRLLLIDSLAASGADREAYAAALDAARRFGDSDALSKRRGYIGARLATEASREAYDALQRGDSSAAVRLAREAVDYAPERIGWRIDLLGALIAAGDPAGAEAAATDALARNDTPIMLWTVRGYARSAQGRDADADVDFARALQVSGATPRDARVARAIIADVWLARGRAQAALDVLAPLEARGDGTDAVLASRRHRARVMLAQGVAVGAAESAGTAERVAASARPVFDCHADRFGEYCDVYAADPGFAMARQAAAAGARGDTQATVAFSRAAVAAAPDDPQHRVELINALANAGEDALATREAKEAFNAGLVDGMTDLSAAYIAERAGAPATAFAHFDAADKAGMLPAHVTGDAGYAARQAHRNRAAAVYFERAVDDGIAPADGTAAATPTQLYDLRSAHADVTRDWGFNASLNYRGASTQSGYASTPTPGIRNNWQAGAEAYWRPFGSLGDRSVELYARGYEDFGVQGGEPSGAATLLGVVGARSKPLASVDAIVAVERILPIGSAVHADWLGRLAYSGGFGTALRVDVPSWWTVDAYAEAGHYVSHPSTYATGNVRAGRSFRIDTVSPRATVFPFAVLGADFNNSIDRSVPVGAGAGVAARYWFRGGKYDAPRSYVDMSVQYRLRVTGDNRAHGVLFGVLLAY